MTGFLTVDDKGTLCKEWFLLQFGFGRLKFLFSKERVDLEEKGTLCKDKFLLHFVKKKDRESWSGIIWLDCIIINVIMGDTTRNFFFNIELTTI